MSRLSKILPILYFLLDISILVLSYVLASYLFKQNFQEGLEGMVLAITLWAMIGYLRRLYCENLNNGFIRRMLNYSKSYLIFAIALLSTVYFLFSFPAPAFKGLLSYVLIFLVLNLVANTLVINMISRWRRRSDNLKFTLVVGVGDLAVKISNYFEANPDFGFRIKGYLRSAQEECKVNPAQVSGMVKDIRAYLAKNTIDEIIIALPYKSRSKRIKKIVRVADLYGIRISYLPDYQGLFGKHFKIIHDGELEAVNVRQLPLDEFYPVIEKVIFDVVFSAMVLVFLWPVFLCISVLIKLDSHGPVFYCPMRVGRGSRTFRIFKFRTMYKNDPLTGGTRSTQVDDSRITRVGKTLRKYNLDELPQFLNVFLGDMSVVGPRPHRIHLSERMKQHYTKYMLRHYFRPGITGWAQVNGWRGPTETDMQIMERTVHDLWYIENWSFALDMKIIWQTIFSRKAYQNAF